MICLLRYLRKMKEQNRLKFFVNGTYTLLLLILGLFLFLIFLNVLENKWNVRESYIFNKRPTIIITNSMEPTVMVNSVVLLEPVEFSDIEVGDIIRYTSYQGFSVLHRVISKNASYVVTKGDNNQTSDIFPVLSDQITGRVVEIHNETAELFTLIFGRFSYEDISGSIARFCLGFFILAFVFVILIVAFILIFETVSITIFHKKYGDEIIENSNYWLELIKDRDEDKEIVQKYLETFKKSNLFKRVILAYRFRRWYNGLRNIEKETVKTNKRLVVLNKMIDVG